MTAVEFLAGASALMLLAAAIRVLPLCVWRLDQSDAWSYAYDAELIREQGSIPAEVKGYYPKPQFTYPWLFAWLLSRQGINDPIRWGSIVNIGLSLLETAVLSGATFLVIGSVVGTDEALKGTLIAMALLATNPSIYSPWMKLYGVHGRTLGAFLSSLFVITTYFGLVAGWAWLVVGPVAIAGLIYSSKFGMQATLLGSIFLSIIVGNIVPLAFFTFCVLVVILASGCKAWRIIQGHIYHSAFYFNVLQHRHRATVHNTWPLTKWIVLSARDLSAPGAIKGMVWTPALRIFLFCPVLLLVYVPIEGWSGLEKYEKDLLVLALMSIAVIPLVTVPSLRFLGEADRYFSFIGSSSLMVALGSVLSDHPAGFEWCLFGAFLNCVALAVFFRLKVGDRPELDTSLEREVGEVINKLGAEAPGRVLVFPQNRSEKFRLFTDAEFVGIHTNVSWYTSTWPIYDKLFPNSFPYPTDDTAYLRGELGVKYVIVDRRFMTREYITKHALNPDDIAVPQGRVEFENSKYTVIAI